MITAEETKTLERPRAYVVAGEFFPGIASERNNKILRTGLGCDILSLGLGPVEAYKVTGKEGENKEDFLNRLEKTVIVQPLVLKRSISPDATWENTPREEVYEDYSSCCKQRSKWEKEHLSFVAVGEKLKGEGFEFDREVFHSRYD